MITNCKTTMNAIIVEYDDNYACAIMRDKIISISYIFERKDDRFREGEGYYYGRIEAQLVAGITKVLWDCVADNHDDCMVLTTRKFNELIA